MTLRLPGLGVLVAAALLAATLVGLSTAPAGAAPLPYENVLRIDESSPRAAAIELTGSIWGDDEAGAVVLAREDAFPDALGASALSTAVDGPILLTPSGDLAREVRDEIVRVLPAGGTVYLLGGQAALSPEVEQALDGLGFRTPRFPGIDRIETAAMIARFVGAAEGGRVLLARHAGNPDAVQGWVDSVSCGGYAANTETPILLTRTSSDTVSDETLQTMSELGVERVDICGGAAAVPESQAQQLRDAGLDVRRHAGDDRVATAVEVARGLWGVTKRDHQTFVLVPGFGTDFGYGLVSTPVSARLDAPILLVGTDTPTSCDDPRTGATLCLLETGDAPAAALVIVGSRTIIDDDVMSAAAEAADMPRDNVPPTVPEGVEVTDRPEDDGTVLDVTWDASFDATGDVTYEVMARPTGADGDLTPANATIKATTGSRSARLSGLTAGTSYDIAVRASDIHKNTSALSTVVAATPTDEVPASPPSDIGPTVAPHSSAGIRVSWLAAPEADVAAYEVQRLTKGFLVSDCSAGLTGDPFATIATVDHPGTVLVDGSASSGTSYCYRYRIVDTSGNTTGWSGAGGPVEAT